MRGALLAAMLLLAPAAGAQDFVKRTYAAGLGSAIATNGVAVADFNGNGLPDVYVVVRASRSTDPITWSRLFRNRGDGTFGLVTPAGILAGADSSTVEHSGYGYKLGASWGDFDNDGFPDLYLTHLGPNQLLRNNGDGTFTDITAEAGVAGGPTQLSTSALWFDYDLDGYLDLYVSVLEDYTSGTRDRSNRLYRNRGDGTFEDVTTASGVGDEGLTWMTVAFDVSGNGYPDLYLANDFGPNTFYLNNGDGTFTEATAASGLHDPHHGMGLAIADVTGNGHFDLYLTNISDGSNPNETNPLFLNQGDGTFADAAGAAGVAHAGWAWGTEFFDAFHTGHEDLFVAAGNFAQDTPNALFRRAASGDLLFENVAAEMGLADLAPARGVAVFDYDGDGDLDVLVSNFFEAPGLFENRAASGAWLKVDLDGTASNRNGLGAVVEVVEATAEGRTQRRLHHGAQFLGQNILPVHFGLGDASGVASVTVRWPSGEVDVVEDVATNQRIRIRETEGMIVSGEPSPAGASRAPRALGAHPNPLAHETTIRFMLAEPAEVTLTVHDLLGRVVHRDSGRFASGAEHAFVWRPSAHLASGVYAFRLAVGSDVARGRMTVMR